jgi:hypothetical protein
MKPPWGLLDNDGQDLEQFARGSDQVVLITGDALLLIPTSRGDNPVALSQRVFDQAGVLFHSEDIQTESTQGWIRLHGSILSKGVLRLAPEVQVLLNTDGRLPTALSNVDISPAPEVQVLLNTDGHLPTALSDVDIFPAPVSFWN